MQRGISGYNILSLLAIVDNKIHPNEDLVIRNWLIKEFNYTKNLDDQLETLIHLKKADYIAFLQKQMDLFYAASTVTERNSLLQFAMNVIKADGKIKKGENKLFDYLYQGWNEEE
jgi:uncharacterized tellurite resistance protein B-like protein